MSFKDKLKLLRKEQNLTQEELAKVLNYTRTAVSGYESGRNEPSYDVLKTLSEYFDVSIDYLLGKTEDRKSDKLISQEKKEILERLKNIPIKYIDIAEIASKKDINPDALLKMIEILEASKK